MRIQRIETKQAHYTPDHVYYAGNIFPAEIVSSPEIIHEYVSQADSGDVALPVGSTAQNDFKELQWFRCKGCGEILSEHKIADHMNCTTSDDGEENG